MKQQGKSTMIQLLSGLVIGLSIGLVVGFVAALRAIIPKGNFPAL